MTDMMIHNMQLVRTALDKKDIRYFTSPHQLIAYMPCRANPKHRKIRPASLRVSITASAGMAFAAGKESSFHDLYEKADAEMYSNKRAAHAAASEGASE